MAPNRERKTSWTTNNWLQTDLEEESEAWEEEENKKTYRNPGQGVFPTPREEAIAHQIVQQEVPAKSLRWSAELMKIKGGQNTVSKIRENLLHSKLKKGKAPVVRAKPLAKEVPTILRTFHVHYFQVDRLSGCGPCHLDKFGVPRSVVCVSCSRTFHEACLSKYNLVCPLEKCHHCQRQELLLVPQKWLRILPVPFFLFIMNLDLFVLLLCSSSGTVTFSEFDNFLTFFEYSIITRVWGSEPFFTLS